MAANQRVQTTVPEAFMTHAVQQKVHQQSNTMSTTATDTQLIMHKGCP